MMESLPSSAPKASFETKLPVRLLISAAVFGVLFSYLFAWQSIGFNVLLFVLAVYAFVWINKGLFIVRRFREEPLMYLACIPVIFLGVMIFTGSTVVSALSILVILFVMFVQYLVLSGVALHEWHQPAFLLDIFFGALNRVLIGIGSFIAGAVNAVFRNSKSNRKSAVFGVLAGIALLLLIVPILMIADANMAAHIVRLAGVKPGDRVIEVGPGLGSLTLALCEAGASVRAVELDSRLAGALATVVEGKPVEIIQADALTVDWPALAPVDSPTAGTR
jgi:hypothetical protein